MRTHYTPQAVGVACLLLGASLAAGCTTYLEKETPAGTVPPTALRPVTGERGREAEEPRVEGNRPKLEDGAEDTLNRFAEAYLAQKQPRIVVYLNRELSENVREWSANARLVTEGEIEVEKAGVAAERVSEKVGTQTGRGAEIVGATAAKVKGKDGIYSEQTRVAEDRPAPAESWMWQMEDSFLGPFLKAKAILVDRGTVLRLAAAETPADSRLSGTEPTVKQIEMAAIKSKADILMEMLVRRNPLAPAGYEFQVNVKEIRTGRILAKASSLAWNQEKQRYAIGKTYEVTEQGYTPVGNNSFPKLDRVTTLLAHDVMRQLISIWAKE